MLQILKCAKGLVLLQRDSLVDLQHIEWAAELLVFDDETVREKFEADLRQNVTTARRPCPAVKTDVQQLLSTATATPTMPLSQAVTELVKRWGGVSKQLTRLAVNVGIAEKVSSESVTTETGEHKATNDGFGLAQIATLKQNLLAKVLGQTQAIEALTDTLVKGTYQARRGGPLGVFLFVGPSATGKTYLAQEVAAQLGEGWSYITVAMAGLTHENQSTDLDGTEPSYNNAQPGRLTSHVRKYPRSVIVFEDPDKANPAVLSRLVPMLTNGVMSDRFGFYPENDPKRTAIAPPEVDFQQSLVIFITRAGEAAYDDANFQQLSAKNPGQAADMVLEELRQLQSQLGNANGVTQFAPGLMDRLSAGRVLLFRPLGLKHLCDLAQQAFDEVCLSFGDRFKCDVSLSDFDNTFIFQALVLSQGPEPDARKVQHAVIASLLDPVTDWMLANPANTTIGCKRVVWEMSEQTRVEVARLLQELGALDSMRAVMRRGLKLSWDFQLELIDETLRAVIFGLVPGRITQASDVRGQGAVRVEVPAVSFAQIAGHHKVKERLKEVISLLKDPTQLRSMDVNVPKGLLLYGPPGTGKTMIAKAFAHEAGLPFIATTGSELLNLAFMRTLFQRARKYAPSLVFIDEIDALGRRDAGGYDVQINQLLIELDGFDTSLSEPVFVVAATNLKDKLDTALLRAGRIDIHVEVPQLDRDARTYFIDRYLNLPNDGSLLRETLLAQTSGMSGADLEQVRREVVLEMLRHSKSNITQPMLLEQINFQKYGPRSSAKKNEQHREMTAYHEAGHAVMSTVLNPDMVIEQVTITGRGDAGGFVSFEQNSEVNRRMTRKEFMDEICVLLAGRLAEQMKFGDEGISAGASSDLAKATRLAEAAITQYGLDERIGLVATAHLSDSGQAGFESLVAERVAFWLTDAQDRCNHELKVHWEQLGNLAEALLESETLSADGVRQIFVKAT